ncbi:S41 family peptidase [Chitinophaga sp. LS1]|uniref:S41 family peptidase n=1 Tax=Chitinophaga sp. LS1 TaxID=3051176 RepID=UPI002AAB5E2D|nr:S41 family peptidase [Chitinophaga sp. LS1]WPV69366.1 S41 family peptidase [Chitinophaga sp. LS1]
MNKRFTLAVLTVGTLCAGFFTACKKESKSGSTTTTTSGTATSDEDSLKYLMYNTMQVSYVNGGRSTTTDLPTYYWYSNVPTMNPLSSTYSTADDLLTAMKAYSVGTGSTALDRYSFLDRTGSLSTSLQDGVSGSLTKVSATSGDFGMEVSYVYADANKSTTYLYVLYADKNSPAGQAGLERGDRITAINGDTDIAYDGSSGTNTTKVTNALFNSTSVSLTVTKNTSKVTASYSLTAATYNINPVLFDTTYTINGSKVGYFVFYTFTSTYTSKGVASPTKTVLDALFTKFKAAGITNLIVDLRYNGGGSVTTAEYLDSAIAPASAAGKTMYYYLYNDKLTANLDQVGLEASVNFPATTGGLALDNVFFITSGNTASASEMTLNNLKPYMNVQLVGTTTYGKPCGFITFTLSDYDSTGKEQYLADLYAINFATENANHTGGYYSGITPTDSAADYIGARWGSLTGDENLYNIQTYLTTGSYPASTGGRLATGSSEGLRVSGPSLNTKKFSGMVDYRIGKKLK